MTAAPVDTVSRVRPLADRIRDYIELTKPSITRMCLITTGGGFWLASPPETGTQWWTMMCALLGTALAVGAANALNMWWERAPDQRMTRTKDRPLASGRLRPQNALVFGLALGFSGMVVLGAGTNLLTALLGAFALLSYVLVYTPLKYRTPLALVVGAVPGAMPPLMGWTAATDGLGAAGLVLFGTLLLWQMPHFLAISVYRKRDYANAGIQIVPVVRGDRVATRQAIAWATALLPLSLMLTPLGVTGTLYFVVALVSGSAFLLMTIAGLWAQNTHRWARKVFIGSLIHLPLLTLALALDVVI